LSFASAFGHSFGEVGEDDGEPQPECDVCGEGDDAADSEVGEEKEGDEEGSDFDDEHDGVAKLYAGVEAED